MIPPMPGRLSAITEVTPQLIATATLRVDTSGAGFTEITSNAANFVAQIGAGEGVLLVYLRHTSASAFSWMVSEAEVWRR